MLACVSTRGQTFGVYEIQTHYHSDSHHLPRMGGVSCGGGEGGHYGYLPTPRQHALGGYETWMGTSILEILASEKIKKSLLKMLEKVADSD